MFEPKITIKELNRRFDLLKRSMEEDMKNKKLDKAYLNLALDIVELTREAVVPKAEQED